MKSNCPDLFFLVFRFLKRHRYYRLYLVLGLFLGWATLIEAQVSGLVYADYNGSSTRTTANPAEPLLSGVIVTAYDAAGTVLASYTTTQGVSPSSANYPYNGPNYSIPASGTPYNGTLGSNTGFVPASTAVRLEFTLADPGTGCTADNTLESGFGSSSVKFVTAPATNVDYGVYNPADYNTGTSGATLFIPQMNSGDPLVSGTSGSLNWFYGFNYSNTGTTAPALIANGQNLGACWGVAYSKQANKIFTSAILKRQSGLGPMGIGGIYLLEPTASSFNIVQFFNMDANAFNTAANPITRVSAAGLVGAPSYGSGNSYSINAANSQATYLGANDSLTGLPAGLGVVGSNAQRGLSTTQAPAYDPAAFDQVGKVGIGDIEISDDGKFLFVMNLYQRRVFRLELNDAYNPTSVVAITSYSIPTVAVTNGQIRPWALKFSKGKLYVGAVASGENESTNTNANLRAHVFELNNATGSASFTATPVLGYPLNYVKGFNVTPSAIGNQWYPWTSDVNRVGSQNPGTGPIILHATPMLTDIEFDERGNLIMAFTDRLGHQQFNQNNRYLANNVTIADVYIGGDILTAGINCSTGYAIENNGSYNSNGVTFASSFGVFNTQGPGGGEFYSGESFNQGQITSHQETSQGAMALLPGTNSVVLSVMDPLAFQTGGVRKFSTINGTSSGSYQLYAQTPGTSSPAKGNGLGDIELLMPLAPLEIGNRVWLDTDKDGVQDAGEAGIGNVQMQLFADFDNNGIPDGAGTALATTTTSTTAGDALGTWYFNATNVTDGDPSVTGNQAGPQPGKRYLIRIGSASWAAGAGTSALLGRFLTGANAGGAGQPDLRDSDASLSASIPTISYLTGQAGENDHTLDMGFISCPTIINPSAAQTVCAGGTGSNITVNTDYNATNGIRFVRFTSDQMAGSTPTTTEAANIYAGTAISTVTPTGASSPYTATYTFNAADFPNATASPIIYYVYAILNPDPGSTCRPTQEIVVTVGPSPATPVVASPVTNFCPFTTINLNNVAAGVTPAAAGNSFEWRVGASPTSALVSNMTAVGAGTYYLFERNTAGCISATGAPVTVNIVTCCAGPNCVTQTATPN